MPSGGAGIQRRSDELVPGRKLEECSRLYLDDLTQIARDGCAPSQGLPSRTFNHFLHTSATLPLARFSINAPEVNFW